MSPHIHEALQPHSPGSALAGLSPRLVLAPGGGRMVYTPKICWYFAMRIGRSILVRFGCMHRQGVNSSSLAIPQRIGNVAPDRVDFAWDGHRLRWKAHSTNGAFGALAFGSALRCRTVLATQTVRAQARQFRIAVEGRARTYSGEDMRLHSQVLGNDNAIVMSNLARRAGPVGGGGDLVQQD